LAQIDAILERGALNDYHLAHSARAAAGDKDIRIGGGVDTIQQYLREGLIDEVHIAIAPTVLGSGERLFEGVDLRKAGYECVRFEASDKAMHVIFHKHPKE
jgi:dihydrofolate reductase